MGWSPGLGLLWDVTEGMRPLPPQEVDPGPYLAQDEEVLPLCVPAL